MNPVDKTVIVILHLKRQTIYLFTVFSFRSSDQTKIRTWKKIKFKLLTTNKHVNALAAAIPFIVNRKI